jgi:hypothetical protein
MYVGIGMRGLKNSFIIIILCSSIMLLQSTTSAFDRIDPVVLAISNTIDQIKVILTQQSSPREIDRIIHQTSRIGSSGYKIFHYSNNDKIGYFFKDDRGRKILSICFSFKNNQAKNCRYIGPLIDSGARSVETPASPSWHRKYLSRYYTQIGPDRYALGNDCVAVLDEFKSSHQASQTIIFFDCS